MFVLRVCPLVVLSLGLCTIPARGQPALRIDPDGSAEGSIHQLSIVLESADPVEGFTISIQHDPGRAVVLAVDTAGTATDAVRPEHVTSAIYPEAGGFTLDVILDKYPPYDGQTVPPGESRLAFFRARAEPLPGDAIVFEFIDGQFNDPPRDNSLLVDGTWIGRPEGLTFQGGSITVGPPPPSVFEIDDVEIPAMMGQEGNTKVKLTHSFGSTSFLSTDPTGVDGFTLAIQHSPAELIDLVGIGTGGTITEEVGAELVITEIIIETGIPLSGGSFLIEGGTMQVVLDAEPPFDGQVIPPGEGLEIANFTYQSEVDFPSEGSLIFADQLADVENTILVLGQVFFPETMSGDFFVDFFGSDFIRGDCNADGIVDIADGIYLLTFLFQVGPEPTCTAACDVDLSGSLGVGDAMAIFDFRLLDGPPPPAPFPDCGPDAGGDCAAFGPCP